MPYSPNIVEYYIMVIPLKFTIKLRELWFTTKPRKQPFWKDADNMTDDCMQMIRENNWKIQAYSFITTKLNM